MKKISFLAAAIGLVMASCGDAKKGDKEMSHDEMHESGMEHHDHDHDSDHNHDEMHDDHGHDHDAMDHDHDAMEENAADNGMMAIPEGANVSFGNLEDGATVTSPVKVEFMVEGMGVEPAGELHEAMGHHHIIINGGALDNGAIVPADETNIHFGQGQSETELDLPVGTHTLTLQFADGYHRSYGEQMSKTITVNVQ